ncbi:MAG: ATP synthase F1 subunit delta, partial [Deltaproteobacteria bacterium]
MSDIAKRYAKAFFEVAKEENKIELYYGELSAFASLVQSSKELQGYFANPISDEEGKMAIVIELAEKMALLPLTKNFLSLLVEKGRVNILSSIGKSYGELMDKELGRAMVDVRTAFPLTDELKVSLQGSLERLTKKVVQMRIVEDASLLGGLIIKIGDTLYDGSVKTQLNNISNLLG